MIDWLSGPARERRKRLRVRDGGRGCGCGGWCANEERRVEARLRKRRGRMCGAAHGSSSETSARTLYLPKFTAELGIDHVIDTV